MGGRRRRRGRRRAPPRPRRADSRSRGVHRHRRRGPSRVEVLRHEGIIPRGGLRGVLRDAPRRVSPARRRRRRAQARVDARRRVSRRGRRRPDRGRDQSAGARHEVVQRAREPCGDDRAAGRGARRGRPRRAGGALPAAVAVPPARARGCRHRAGTFFCRRDCFPYCFPRSPSDARRSSRTFPLVSLHPVPSFQHRSFV